MAPRPVAATLEAPEGAGDLAPTLPIAGDGTGTETVKSDTKRAILKLEADTRVHAVAIALRQAIIE